MKTIKIKLYLEHHATRCHVYPVRIGIRVVQIFQRGTREIRPCCQYPACARAVCIVIHVSPAGAQARHERREVEITGVRRIPALLFHHGLRRHLDGIPAKSIRVRAYYRPCQIRDTIIVVEREVDFCRARRVRRVVSDIRYSRGDASEHKQAVAAEKREIAGEVEPAAVACRVPRHAVYAYCYCASVDSRARVIESEVYVNLIAADIAAEDRVDYAYCRRCPVHAEQS